MNEHYVAIAVNIGYLSTLISAQMIISMSIKKEKKKEFVSISQRPTAFHSWPIFSQMTLDEDDEKYTSHGLKKKKKNTPYVGSKTEA